MKRLYFTSLILLFFSVTGFAGQIGEHEVQTCSLIVAPNTDAELLSNLMAKGYRPMNLLGASRNPQDVKDLVGFPYLEEHSLNLKIVGDLNAHFPAENAPNCSDSLTN